MDSELNYHAAKAALDWQIELGATEAIGEVPVDRFEIPEALPKVKAVVAEVVAVDAPVAAPIVDGVAVAKGLAKASDDLDALQAALASFELCELKRGARSTVFCDGDPAARVMIIGEAPGRDEDMQGKPFVGRAGQLLDKMFGAIGLERSAADASGSIYITNVMPWRPPQNREPTPEEIAMMLPFVERHIELVQPDVLVLVGNVSCLAMLGRKGITRLRGNWQNVLGRPAMPMFHPAYLLRNPAAKREAWQDLLAVQGKLRELG